MKPTRVSAQVLGVLALALFAGCGPSVGTVAGKVTVGDKPVTEGRITIIPADGQGITTAIGPDGNYRVDNVPVGEVKIIVLGPPPPQEELRDLKVKGKEGRRGPPPGSKIASPIPARYGDSSTSGLTLTVKPGVNPFDIPMTP
jgi:hypothetical protein